MLVDVMTIFVCKYYLINKERLQETLITHNIITEDDLHSDEDEVDMED